MMTYVVHTDASWRPSRMTGIGFVVSDDEGNTILRNSLRIAGVRSSNIAEMAAIREALKHCRSYADIITRLELRTDSRTTVQKISHGWNAPYRSAERPFLASILDSITWFAQRNIYVHVMWTPRQYNVHADALAGAALHNKLS